MSKSSVSTWVRDIVLTPEQEAALQWNNKRYEAQRIGSKANVLKHRELRQQYQDEGRQKARECDLLHAQGCMLYWAEGGKKRSDLIFVNSDPDMITVFIRFLRESLNVLEEMIKVRIYCYLDNGLSLEEIEAYWQNLLNINRNQMRKASVNNQPVSSQQKGRKLHYGVCHMTVNNVRYLQHIYGAIQEYSGINKPEWLD